jgi:hypothetical protein
MITKKTWELYATTGDPHGIFNALRLHEKQRCWADQFLNTKDPVFSDDEDSDVCFSIEVETLAELSELLPLLQGTKHLSGLTLFAAIETDNGVRVQTGIGRGFAEKDDTIHCEVAIDEQQRQDAKGEAIDKAIAILKAATNA